jgi:Protein of unknown function (DUF1559)
MWHRRAVRRVEVLVGLLVALLVVGLFFAGVGKARSAGQQVVCSNNLKNLGLGVHNYLDTNGTLPPLTDQDDGAPTGRGLPSLFGLLPPYLEGTTLVFQKDRAPDFYYAHSSVEFRWLHKGYPHTQHGGMANQLVRTYLDPADATAHELRDVRVALPDGATGYYAAGSYAANGLLQWGTGTIPESFPRGTANTLLMAERPQVCRTAAGEEVHNLWGVGFYAPQMPAFARLTPSDRPGLAPTGQAAPVEPLPPDDGPVMVRIGRKDAGPAPPDFPTPVRRVRDGRCDPRLPGGPHPAGLLVLMADGGARVLDWETGPWVFWTACVPGAAGGE